MGTSADWHSRPLVDELADLMRERILEGRHRPGAPLSQRRLADELNVNRAVVGEVLRVLQREGLVTVAPPGRGLRVAPDDRSMMMSAYALREVLDGLAARLAARHAGPALEPTLRAAVTEQRVAVEAGEPKRYMRANVGFHGAIIDGSGNPLLQCAMTLVRSTSRTVAVLGEDRLWEAIDEHEAILAAIGARQSEEAELAARAHVRATVAAHADVSGATRGAAGLR